MSTVIPMPQAASPDAGDALHATSVALMARVKHGDERAFAELVALHQSAVVGTAAKMLGNLHDAHDIAQQTFVRVWKSAPRYEPTAKFTTWLFTIVRNLVFNETRRQSRHPGQSLELLCEESGLEPPDSAERPDEEASRAELEAAIDAAIQSLPEHQRMAVVLRRYEDLPYEEIAEVLEISLSAVKSLLFRARAELRAKLQRFLEGTDKGA